MKTTTARSTTPAPAGAPPAPRRSDGKRRRSRILQRYRDGNGATRELIARPAAHGTVLVLDRDPLSRKDERLVAHLAADEPTLNAAIACRIYLDAHPDGRRCRLLAPADMRAVPFQPPDRGAGRDLEARRGLLVSGATCAFRLALVPTGMSIPALRWTRGARFGARETATPVSLREAIATLESYEPLRELTASAIVRYENDPSVSCSVLRAELLRVLDSPIVLNRGLREAVLAKLANGEASMSELAIRCGRLKRDGKNTTGETSWLARRIGLLPEGGHDQPTRWVHSDVLALIARAALGVAPLEVELG